MALTSHQKKIILIAVAAVALVIFLGVFFRKPRPKPLTLEIWGLSDESAVFAPLIQGFQKIYPHISINYISKDEATYHEDLLNSLVNNKAPDILMLQDNWLPYYQDKIYPLDLTKDKYFNLLDLEQTYSQIARNETIKGNYLLGLPLYTDTLALYYNKDIFDYYNVVLPPRTWEEILNLIPTLRRVNPRSQITRAAISLGSASNVEWETDIISSLMMQYGTGIVDVSKKGAIFHLESDRGGKKIIPGEESLNFYTQFANPRSPYYTWNDNFNNSVIAFSRGETVMMIGYNKAKKIIEEYGPNLNYKISSLPQFAGTPSVVNYGYTMTLAVLRSSGHPQESWNFLKFLSQKNNAEHYFLQTKNPPARLDLIQAYLNDLDSGIFIRQISTSQNWYQYDFQEIEQIFKEMISAVTLKGEDSLKAINAARDRINYFWNQ
ncbi:MAG: extracellular solute-binding protein [Candidatus Pacebacteria bacterium]|nr:extracellular solute-binding protein [Candidatus Paceibacterota bacterium]